MTWLVFVIGFMAGGSMAVFIMGVIVAARERGPQPKWPADLELPSLAPIPENPAVIVKPYGRAK